MLIYCGRKGGGALYSIEMAKAISNKVDLTVVISKQVENLSEWRKTGISLIEVNTYYNLKTFVISSLNLYKFIKLKNVIKKVKPDIIYYTMIHPWIPIINFLTHGIPKVYTAHDIKMHKGEENLILSMTNKVGIKNSKRVIVLSKVFKNDLTKFGINKDKIDVIPHAKFSHYIKVNKGKKSDFSKTILFFGRIHEYKGIRVLLKAFKIIKTMDDGAKLLIVGNGNMTPYEQLIKNSKDVFVVNRWIKDDEVGDFFSKADIVVLPYIDASQSGIIPIAYTFSIPVVASRIGGIPEQVDDGKTGILVEPRNEVELADACVKLLKNKQLLSEMGKNAYNKCLNEMSWDYSSKLLYESFKKVIEDK
ncbi:glycosyltransferase family 4 protein [Clostridium sp. JN-1]|uniref:glycosyltransferase family 4 protein n=1 Tax=Clostridium sp. JN-1 TaxID=2483110 RepID=UPI001FAAEBC7|nr:glycosyltransferase family 4 protein [Clostridium sp. JN-1]